MRSPPLYTHHSLRPMDRTSTRSAPLDGLLPLCGLMAAGILLARRRSRAGLSDAPRMAALGNIEASEAPGLDPDSATASPLLPQPALYVVATPIGNLRDITLRALDVLRAVDVVAAEDTRHTGNLLRHYGIRTPMRAYHDHSLAWATEALVDELRAGRAVALVSDAGTPLLSDPGHPLVAAVRRNGFPVVPIPGASALLAALCAVGLPTDRFAFEGFSPPKAEARLKRLRDLAADPRTLVFYEAPHRLVATLEAMIAAFGGDREAAVARELTKRFETIHRGTLADLLRAFTADGAQCRGEMVVVVKGCEGAAGTDSEERLRSILSALMGEGNLSPKTAATLAVSLTGDRRNAAYRIALDLQQSPTNPTD